MTRAIEDGLPKLRIEEAAARAQARIDSGASRSSASTSTGQPTRRTSLYSPVDNAEVRAAQLARLERLRDRDAKAVGRPRGPPDAAHRSGRRAGRRENLLALSIEAARRRATVGEISSAMEEAFGRHRATIRAVSGVYDPR